MFPVFLMDTGKWSSTALSPEAALCAGATCSDEDESFLGSEGDRASQPDLTGSLSRSQNLF